MRVIWCVPTVRVSIDAIPGEQLVGVVSEVGVASRSATIYPVTVALQERCSEVRSGMAADVVFRFPTMGPAGRLVVPFVSVGEDPSGRFVFVLEPQQQELWVAKRRDVEVTGPTPSGLVVTSGLNEGELIATAGVRRLTDGQTVTLLSESDQP